MKNDLSQIEFRLGAHYGVGPGAEDVREKYRRDPRTDFYSMAQEFTGLNRQDTKSVSLGTLYGMREKKFAAMTGRSLEEAYEVFGQFNERLPFMRATYDAVGKEALENGFVRTIGGRICNLDANFTHKALNRKLQGSCADWIKLSMLRAYRAGIFDTLKLYLTVHDELDSGVPRTPEGIEAARELHHLMTHAYQLQVPVLAGIDLGRNWGELHEHEPDALDLAHLNAVV
jgi:DNA polymerase I-like protein with 3'-5' exonuclease and polymerase domains